MAVLQLLLFCYSIAFKRFHLHDDCRHLLKLEQEIYKAEGIEWSHVNFKDSSSCLELFEGVVKQSMSILSLLDEECVFPQVMADLKTLNCPSSTLVCFMLR